MEIYYWNKKYLIAIIERLIFLIGLRRNSGEQLVNSTPKKNTRAWIASIKFKMSKGDSSKKQGLHIPAGKILGKSQQERFTQPGRIGLNTNWEVKMN